MAPKAHKKPTRKKPAPKKLAKEKEKKTEAVEEEEAAEEAETTPAGKKRRAEKPVMSSNGGGSAGDKKKKSRQNDDDEEEFQVEDKDCKPLILDVLKEINPSHGISRRSLTFLNDYINNFRKKFWQEAYRIVDENSIDIITPSELDAAVYRLLPEDFSKYVVSEANKVVAKFLSS